MQRLFIQYSTIIKRYYSLSISKLKNKGELAEVSIIKKILTLSLDNKQTDLVKIFGRDAIGGITLYNLDSKNIITDINSIKKSNSSNKADCIIKFNNLNKLMYVSIKCMNFSNPSILNHTPRSAKVFQKGEILFEHLDKLDKLIWLMNKERINRIVGEDILISKQFPTLDPQIKKSIIDTIVYFMFYGTGKGVSTNPSNSILEIYNLDDFDKWKFFNLDNKVAKLNYINNLYNKLIFSMRDKGMPKFYNSICEPWIFYQKISLNNLIQFKLKGSLHVRIKNK